MAGLMVTKRDIRRAEAYLARRDPASSSKTSHYVSTAVQSGEIAASTFLMGFAKGKYGPISLGPVPADLLGFGLLTAAGLFFSGSKASKHLHNVADGLGASYFNTLGMGVGVSVGHDKPFKAAPTISGPAAARGQFRASTAPLTEAELRAMAQAVR
jgi:hypothetical protein